MTYIPRIGQQWWETRPAYMGPASIYDDEFLVDSSGDWTFSPTLSGSAIDMYTPIATNPRVSWNGIRKHLSFQPVDAVQCYMSKPITLDTDCWVWMSATISGMPITAPTTTIRATWKLGLAEQGAFFAAGDFLYIQAGPWDNASTDSSCRFTRKANGVDGNIAEFAYLLNSTVQITHVFIQKDAGVYYAFVGDDTGTWWELGSYDYVGASGVLPDTLSLNFFDDGGVPGSRVFQPRFIRYGTGVITLP